MLTKNQINKSQKKTFLFLSRNYRLVKEYLYKTTGLELVKSGNGYKLLIEPVDDFVIARNETSTTYEVYLLTVATLLTKPDGSQFLQEELAEEVLEMVSEESRQKDNVDKAFKLVISYLIDGKFLSVNNIIEEQGEFRVLTKRAQPIIYTGEKNVEKLSPKAKIIKYLLTHHTMNKLEHPDLWRDVSDEEIISVFEGFFDGEVGYRLSFNGDVIKVISIGDPKAFPNLNNAIHRFVLEHTNELQESKDIGELLKKEKKSISSNVTTTAVEKVLQDYGILEFKINLIKQ